MLDIYVCVKYGFNNNLSIVEELETNKQTNKKVDKYLYKFTLSYFLLCMLFEPKRQKKILVPIG
jgi:hypothetical protein